MVIGTTKSFQESHAPNRIRKSYFATTPKYKTMYFKNSLFVKLRKQCI